MADPNKKVRRGERLQGIPAAAWNGFVDASKARRNDLVNNGAGPNALGDTRQTGIVLVQNVGDALVDQFGVLGLGPPIILPADNEAEFVRRPTFEGDVPVKATHGARFAILLEPIASGDIGKAVVSGVTVGRVHVTTAQLADPPMRAEIDDTDSSRLALSASGPAEVLWQETLEAEGDAWALLRLGGVSALSDCTGLMWLDPGLDCVTFEIKAGVGRCAAVVADGPVYGGYDDDESCWIGEDTLATDMDDWIPRYYLPDCASTQPRLTLTGPGSGGTVVCGVYKGCRDGSLVFSVGGAAACGGTADPCADNSFEVLVACAEPTTRWWCVEDEGVSSCVAACVEPVGAVSGPFDTQAECLATCGDPWWCVADTDCEADPTRCVQSEAEPVGVTICSGPHDSFAECHDVCQSDGDGSGGGSVGTDCCGNALPQTLYLTITGSTASCLNGIIPLVYVGGQEWMGDSACGPDGQSGTVRWRLTCIGNQFTLVPYCHVTFPSDNEYLMGGGGVDPTPACGDAVASGTLTPLEHPTGVGCDGTDGAGGSWVVTI